MNGSTGGIDVTGEVVHLVLSGIVGLCSLVIAAVGYIVRGFARGQKELAAKVEKLERTVAILCDRDRRKRLEDYETEAGD